MGEFSNGAAKVRLFFETTITFVDFSQKTFTFCYLFGYLLT